MQIQRPEAADADTAFVPEGDAVRSKALEQLTSRLLSVGAHEAAARGAALPPSHHRSSPSHWALRRTYFLTLNTPCLCPTAHHLG